MHWREHSPWEVLPLSLSVNKIDIHHQWTSGEDLALRFHCSFFSPLGILYCINGH